MRFGIILLPILLFGIFLDWRTKTLLKQSSIKSVLLKRIILSIHNITSIIFPLGIISMIFFSKKIITEYMFVPIIFFFFFFLLFYVPKYIYFFFILVDLFINKIIGSKDNKKETLVETSRRKFIKNLGLTCASIPVASMLYGMAWGRFNFRVYRSLVNIPNLPESFKGFKIIQISDTHLGSFNENYDKLSEVVKLINAEEADLLLHTGDLVNNFASELNQWPQLFQQIEVKVGKYAILGNHDYGDYFDWESDEEKLKNFNAIKKGYLDCGFQLLLNDNVKISNGIDNVELIGVENWGEFPFSKHADLEVAMSGVDKDLVKILLTHNPRHWEKQIMDKDLNIALTLSGHTHGMQMGVQLENFKWSPSELGGYKRWGGLYKEGDQQLYVNRGLGYVGLPMRIGMDPEVTVLTLG